MCDFMGLGEEYVKLLDIHMYRGCFLGCHRYASLVAWATETCPKAWQIVDVTDDRVGKMYAVFSDLRAWFEIYEGQVPLKVPDKCKDCERDPRGCVEFLGSLIRDGIIPIDCPNFPINRCPVDVLMDEVGALEWWEDHSILCPSFIKGRDADIGESMCEICRFYQRDETVLAADLTVIGDVYVDKTGARRCQHNFHILYDNLKEFVYINKPRKRTRIRYARIDPRKCVHFTEFIREGCSGEIGECRDPNSIFTVCRGVCSHFKERGAIFHRRLLPNACGSCTHRKERGRCDLLKKFVKASHACNMYAPTCQICRDAPSCKFSWAGITCDEFEPI